MKKNFSVFLFALLLSCLFAMGAVAEDTVITLSDNGISCDAPGLAVSGSVLTISLPGDYHLTGALSNGQIIVDCPDTGKVNLYFENVSIHCEDSAALYIKKCSPRLSVHLADGSVNTLSGGAVYQLNKDEEPSAVLFSKDDLTITGTGTLNVTALFRDGIVSKDDLRIKGGIINVTAPHNGIKGKDDVEIFDGTITVKAGNDGIKSNNDTDPARGYVEISGGSIIIECGGDPISVETRLSVTGGSVQATIVDENK